MEGKLRNQTPVHYAFAQKQSTAPLGKGAVALGPKFWNGRFALSATGL